VEYADRRQCDQRQPARAWLDSAFRGAVGLAVNGGVRYYILDNELALAFDAS
jgi:hypothetical protein